MALAAVGGKVARRVPDALAGRRRGGYGPDAASPGNSGIKPAAACNRAVGRASDWVLMSPSSRLVSRRYGCDTRHFFASARRSDRVLHAHGERLSPNAVQGKQYAP
jgi:hypothetical protein